MTLHELDEELDILMLRRAKLEMLVQRLRAVHLRLTRTGRFRPVVKRCDSALEVEYVPHHEPAGWEGRPRSKPNRSPYERDGRGARRR